MRREICGEKKTSKRLTPTQWGWTQQSVLSSLVCSHPSYPCMSLILDYKESGGVAFTTKETCTAGRTKKRSENHVRVPRLGFLFILLPTSFSLVFPPPYQTPPNHWIRNFTPPKCFHFTSYLMGSLSQSGISIWSEMAKEKNHQWNIQHIHIWMLLMEGSSVFKGRSVGGGEEVWLPLESFLNPLHQFFFCFTRPMLLWNQKMT